MAKYGQSKKLLAYALKALGQELIDRSDELAETTFGIGFGLVVRFDPDWDEIPEWQVI